MKRDRFTHLVRQATNQTEMLVLSVGGTMRPAYFTSSCGGKQARRR